MSISTPTSFLSTPKKKHKEEQLFIRTAGHSTHKELRIRQLSIVCFAKIWKKSLTTRVTMHFIALAIVNV